MHPPNLHSWVTNMQTLSVNIKGKPVTFETDLEWANAIEMVRQVAKSGNTFAASLVEREDKDLYFSPVQVAWVYKLAEDAIKREKHKENYPSKYVDASNLLNALKSAHEAGGKKPMIRLAYYESEIRIKYVHRDYSPSNCWVTIKTDGGPELCGMIDHTGAFKKVGASNVSESDLLQFITWANADVKLAIESYGRETNRCGCCGLPLTNKKSIELGIGPICLEKFAL